MALTLTPRFYLIRVTPVASTGGKPDPELEREIRNIRGESNQAERRTKLYKLVERLGKSSKNGIKVEEIDIRFFTWLIGILGEQGMLKQALLVLDKVKAKGVKPDAILYNTLIGTCSKLNKLKQALQVYEDMRKQGVSADQRTLSTVMSVFSRLGDIDKVKALRAEMEGSGQHLDSFNYGCMMKAFGQNGKVDDMLALWNEVRDKEKAGQLAVDPYLYTITIDNLGRNGKVKEMLDLWKEMKYRAKADKGKKLRPDVVAYTTLIDNLGRNGDIERMMSTLHEMKHEASEEDKRLKEEKERRKVNFEIEPLKEKTPAFELWPNVQTYACIFNHLGKAGDVQRMTKIYDDIKRDSLFPMNVRIYTALIDGAGDLARMQKIFDGMKKEEIRPTIHTYTALIDAFAKHGSVRHQGLPPDSRLFHALVKGLGTERKSDTLDVFWYMRTQQLRVTPFIYARVVEALDRSHGDARTDHEMELVVAEAEKDGVELDRTASQAIAAMWERRCNHRESARWAERAKNAREFVGSGFDQGNDDQKADSNEDVVPTGERARATGL